MILWFLFILSLFALLHSYALYPLLLRFLARNKKLNYTSYTPGELMPPVSIIMSVYNEEKVLTEKIRSVFSSEYPAGQIEFLIGSDGSTDQTVDIIQDLQTEFPGLKLLVSEKRLGKGNILNLLVPKASGEILIFTDAKVIFTQGTLFELVKYFKDSSTGLVGGNLINRHFSKEGIAIQEYSFMTREFEIKMQEGLIWGTTMGAYGACFAMRRELFRTIPPTNMAEDFFLSMHVLTTGHKAFMNLEAKALHNVPHTLGIEFRRRVRIAVGNFQNLAFFGHLLWPPFTGRAFSFLSHKVLRWLGPFSLLLLLGSSFILAPTHLFPRVSLWIMLILLLLPALDYLLRKIHIHIVLLRFITHFFSMNIALLVGFFKYIKGIDSNVWEPTKRN